MRAPTNAQLKAEVQWLNNCTLELEGQYFLLSYFTSDSLDEMSDQLATEHALRIAAEDCAAEKEVEVREAQAQAAEVAQQAEVAIAAVNHQAAQAAEQQHPGHNVLIPRPRGSGGSTYNIRRAMGLGNDKARYVHCMVSSHRSLVIPENSPCIPSPGTTMLME